MLLLLLLPVDFLMALQTNSTNALLPKSVPVFSRAGEVRLRTQLVGAGIWARRREGGVFMIACKSSSSSDGGKKAGGVPNSNYVVPLDKSFSSSNSSCITRPLVEILRDLNKRIPDNIIQAPPHHHSTLIPW